MGGHATRGRVSQQRNHGGSENYCELARKFSLQLLKMQHEKLKLEAWVNYLKTENKKLKKENSELREEKNKSFDIVIAY